MTALWAWLKSLSPLTLALTASLLAHAGVLSLHFALPDVSRTLRDKGLDVILVNTRSARKPVDAQALAQVDSDGGGDLAENRRATSPLPVSKRQSEGDSLQAAQRRVQEMEVVQKKLATQLKSSQSVPQKTGEKQPEPKPASPSGRDLADMARAMARLEAEIAKQQDDYNQRPRKMFPGVRALGHERALYEDAWREKVERLGAVNFPQDARGRLYGALLVTVTLDVEGAVVDVSVDRSSGKKALDEAARAIIRRGSPYGPLPPGIRRQYDQLVIVRTITFERDDSVSSK